MGLSASTVASRATKQGSPAIVSRVQGRADLVEGRPPVIACALDMTQDDESGILVVTPYRVENFSVEGGFRKWQHRCSEKGPPIISAALVHRSSIGPVFLVGLANGTVECLLPTSLKVKQTIKCSSSPRMTAGTVGPRLTCVMAPSDTAIVCGFTSGLVRLFFLETGQLVRDLVWPQAALSPVTTSAQGLPLASPLCRRPSAVTSITMYPPKGWLCIGFEAVKQLTNDTVDGQTVLVNLTPPVMLYAFETGTLLATVEPQDDTVVFTKIFSSQQDPTTFYILVVETLSLRIFSLHPPYFQNPPEKIDSVALRIDFSTSLTPTALSSLGRCCSAAFDTEETVAFLLFTEGFVATVAFHVDSPPISYSFYRLLKVPTQEEGPSETEAVDAVSLFSQEDVACQHARYCAALGYENASQTLLVGDSASTVYIAADIFGKHHAKQVLKEDDIQRIQLNAATTFVPTLYVGKRQQQSWFPFADSAFSLLRKANPQQRFHEPS